MTATILPDLIITHRRRPGGGAKTVSDLLIGSVFECLLLEDQVREPQSAPFFSTFKERDAWVRTWKVDKQTAIPSGRFRVVIDKSERFQKMMLHLLDVPGFSGIRAHAGETVDDTEGCPLFAKEVNASGHTVGSSLARDAVFARIQTSLLAGHAVWWDVVNS